MNESKNLYIKYESGMDVGRVLRVIDGAIVNGRIYCNGIEQRDDEVYWVKDCGEWELVIMMPFGDDPLLAVDLSKHGAMRIKVRKKKDY